MSLADMEHMGDGDTEFVTTSSSAFDAVVEILQTVTISLTRAFWF